MFGFGKKKPKPEEHHKLTLPRIEEKDFTPANIAEYLRNDIPILAVYDPVKKPQIDGHWSWEMLLGVEMNGLRQSVSMFRQEGPFLCNYKAFEFDGDPLLHFMLYEVYEMKNSNIMELCNTKLKEAYELYHDENDRVNMQYFYENDFTEEEGLETFRKNPNLRSIYIGKERLVKKADSKAESESKNEQE